MEKLNENKMENEIKKSYNTSNLISIIMPVYNCQEYIQETIESIKNQTYKNWELIIVDDYSTDKSIEIIQEAIKEIAEKTKIIDLKENQGVAIARNIALENARGRYIAYIDADDIWKKEKLEKQLEFISKNNYGFTYTSFTYLRKNNTKKDINIIPLKLDYKKALKDTAILTSTVMIDTNKINKELLKMPNIRRGQDMATWWKILKNNNTAYCLNERLTFYRRRKNSISINKITAIKRTWNLYRNVEKFSLIKSMYYFSFYAINAIKKRII